MTRAIIGFVFALGLPCVAVAQTQMVRAAGMPLNDGSLPPGSLTVRLVQGAFAGDLPGVTIEVELNGRETRRAPTGEKGRAEFAHLPIGAQVRARAIVNGDRLESEPFPMPAESGVRLLLVAGADAAGPTASTALTPAAIPLPSTTKAPRVTAIQIVVFSLTILAFIFVGVQQWRRRPRF